MKIIHFKHRDTYLEKYLENLLNIIMPLNGWICGGLPSYLYQTYVRYQKTEVFHDIDIFCQDQNSYDKIVDKVKIFINPWEIKETEWYQQFSSSYKVQVIKPKQTRNLQEHLETFDLSCAQFALTHLNELTSLEGPQQQIKISNVHNPHYTLYRITKYCRRGWTIDSPELIKLFIKYQEASDEYKKELNSLLLNYETAPLKERFKRMMHGYTF